MVLTIKNGEIRYLTCGGCDKPLKENKPLCKKCANKLRIKMRSNGWPL